MNDDNTLAVLKALSFIGTLLCILIFTVFVMHISLVVGDHNRYENQLLQTELMCLQAPQHEPCKEILNKE